MGVYIEGWQAKVHIYDSYAKEDVYFCLSTLDIQFREMWYFKNEQLE